MGCHVTIPMLNANDVEAASPQSSLYTAADRMLDSEAASGMLIAAG